VYLQHDDGTQYVIQVNDTVYLQHDDNTLLTDSQVLVTFNPPHQRLVATLHINHIFNT